MDKNCFVYLLVCWSVGWFCSMSTLVGLSYRKVSLTIIVSNYIQCKNVASQLF